MTTLIVDGYNAVYAIPTARERLKSSLRDARGAILSICREYARTSGFIDQVKVVFDGDEKYRYLDRSGKGHEIFSGKGKGDDKIIQTVRLYSGKGRVIVASNDNYVRNNARAHGASVMGVEALAVRKRPGRRRAGGARPVDRELYDDITREYREQLGI